MADKPTIRVVSLLNGDEYLAMQAMAKVSEERRLREMEEPAQVLRSGS